MEKDAYLLNGHHDLNNIETVQAQVVCEVGSSVNLIFHVRPSEYRPSILRWIIFRAKGKPNLAGIGNLFHTKILALHL
jgi:hypothetical protein